MHEKKPNKHEDPKTTSLRAWDAKNISRYCDYIKRPSVTLKDFEEVALTNIIQSTEN